MSRVGIISDNSIAYVESLLKIWNNKDSAVLIDWRIPPQKVAQLFDNANVKMCYLESNKFEKFSKELNIPLIEIESAHTDVNPLPQNIVNSFNQSYEHEEAVVLFSSGTTGKAKGISLSHYAIQKNADAVIKYMLPNTDDGIYIVKTLAHSSTLVGELLVGLKVKSTIYLSSTIASPTKTLRDIGDTNSTILCTNPTLLSIYVMALKSKKYDLSKLKKIYVSGSMMNYSQMTEARKAFGYSRIYNVYGLTEAGPRVCAQTDENYNIEKTVGKPIKNVSVKIVDIDSRELPIGKQGLIMVKTDTHYTSYINEDNSHKNLDNKYIKTGDLGYKDDEGNVFIVGRYDDMIIKGSHNIFPDSIEDEILNYPLIKDCIVFGHDDTLYGQKITCLFVSKGQKININDIRQFCGQRMASYEVPDDFLSVSDIPRTPGGKKSRELARIMYKGVI